MDDRGRKFGASDLLFPEEVRARVAGLLERDPELAAFMPDVRAAARIRDKGLSSTELLTWAFELYSDRPCFAMRDFDAADGVVTFRSSYTFTTYGQAWARMQSLAAGLLRAKLVSSGERIGICGAPSPEWLISDVACLLAGAVSVPIHPSLTADKLRSIVRETRLRVILCGADLYPVIANIASRCPDVEAIVCWSSQLDLARTARPVPRDGVALIDFSTLEDSAEILAMPSDEQRVVTINYSAGSSGPPKGVMLTEARWRDQLSFPLEWPEVPQLRLGHATYSHIAGRRLAHETLMAGGCIFYPAEPNLASHASDFALARPTIVDLVPAFATTLLTRFRDRAAALHPDGERDHEAAESVLAEMRSTALGDRVCLIRIGAAMSDPRLRQFLCDCFQVHVADGYGSTEIGSIAINGTLLPHLEYRLRDAPELGFLGSDLPHPRGELLIRSSGATLGYYGDPESSSTLFDADGFYATGDLVEKRGPDQIAVLGRRGTVTRLAHGEFVNLPELEVLFSLDGSLIRQIFLSASPLDSHPLAIVVPGDDAMQKQADDLLREIRSELARTAARHGLASHQIPRDIIVEKTPFSSANGLLTEKGSLNRPALLARYEARIRELADEGGRRTRAATHSLQEPQLVTHASIYRAMATALSIDEDQLGGLGEVSFVGLGGSSLDAQRFCQALEDSTGLAVPVNRVLDPSTSLESLVREIETLSANPPPAPTFELLHHDARQLRASEVVLDRLLGEVPEPGPPVLVGNGPRSVLLTGATGFLGRFLALELLAQTSIEQLWCLVRGASPTMAIHRLRTHIALIGAEELERFDTALAEDRLRVIVGDTGSRGLGVSGDVTTELGQHVEVIVHNAALVNHTLSYRQVFEPNVGGTAEVIRLAMARPGVAIHFVSSIGLCAGHGRRVTEDETADRLFPVMAADGDAAGNEPYAHGYLASKWASEILLQQYAVRSGSPVCLYRCGVVMPHSKVGRQLNDSDNLNRLLYSVVRTGLAPVSFYGAGASRHELRGITSDSVARALVTGVFGARPGLRIFHVDSDPMDGVSMDTLVEGIEASGQSLERLPYADWIARMTNALGSAPLKVQRLSILPTGQRWMAPLDPGRAPRFENAESQAVLGSLGPTPISNPRYLERWISDLRAR